jgi:hypothetical protein
MQIKRHKNKNEYVLTPQGFWVRNFTLNVIPVDINKFSSRSDYGLLTQNEIEIRSQNYPEIGSTDFKCRKCLIVSDGFSFKEKIEHLLSLPKDVCVIGVNRSLAKWYDKSGNLLKRQMNFFLVNNPYESCRAQMPKHRYFPPCIISSRTFKGFVDKYPGNIYRYVPVLEECIKHNETNYYQIDDYRNPICAALGLAYRFKAEKIALYCCDDSFNTSRPGAIQLDNGLWTYPQHMVSHGLIEGNIYWLKDYGIEVADFSSGPKYEMIDTKLHADVKSFFG